jgi:hypothetical protein
MNGGLVAEFTADDAIVRAARDLRGRGYRELDAFVPRPVEGLEQALQLGRSNLNRGVLLAGVLGAATGLLVQWYCNGWDYPLNVGGRPPFSLPAFIPITFEIMVLFASLTAFVMSLRRGKLPWLTHPLFYVDGFERVSSDRFWLWVGGDDPVFAVERTRETLQELGAETIHEVPDADARAQPSGRPSAEPAP